MSIPAHSLELPWNYFNKSFKSNVYVIYTQRLVEMVAALFERI